MAVVSGLVLVTLVLAFKLLYGWSCLFLLLVCVLCLLIVVLILGFIVVFVVALVVWCVS